MILFQQDTGMIGNGAESGVFIFYLEIIILILIGLRQLYLSFKIYYNIQELKNIFRNGLLIVNRFIDKKELNRIINVSEEVIVDSIGEVSKEGVAGNDILKLALVDSKDKSKIIVRIKDGINTYLVNNYGAAVNFSIIKDIIDREVDVIDEEISQSITVPLYLGLAATMFGIVLGLWSMPSMDGENFSNGINALIEGVQWAMLASLFGLACTTILSSRFYKHAKRHSLKDKNTQLSYLQAKLLPELIRAEDTGVSGLKASLDRFARVATDISDNVLIASNQTGENLVLQQEVIDKIQNMEVLKVSKANLELFDRLDNNMELLDRFSSNLARIEEISSNLLEFSKRTSNIDYVIQHIDSTLTESNKLSKFLSIHFDKIESSGSAALKAVGLAESHFEDAIESLKRRTDEMINQLYKSTGNHEVTIENIYKDINANLNKITADYIEEFSNAYAGSVPKFEQLDNLSLLPEIKTNSNTNAQELVHQVNKIQEILNTLNSNIKDQANKYKGGRKNKELNNEPDDPPASKRPEKLNNGEIGRDSDYETQPLSIQRVIKNLFSNAKTER